MTPTSGSRPRTPADLSGGTRAASSSRSLRSSRKFGRGDDTLGHPHRAQISQLELLDLILLLTLDKLLPVEQFETAVSQSTVPSPTLTLTPLAIIDYYTIIYYTIIDYDTILCYTVQVLCYTLLYYTILYYDIDSLAPPAARREAKVLHSVVNRIPMAIHRPVVRE